MNIIKRKGILLAGGMGSRLHPLTKAVSKQLLPVFDKPMIYYSLTTLMLANIRDILLIVKQHDLSAFTALLGDGSQWGINIEYAIQKEPNGIAEALLIGENFIANQNCALALGDNIFYSAGFSNTLVENSQRQNGATIFCKILADPRPYGVLHLDNKGSPQAIIEKPQKIESKLAVTGLYFYDSTASDRAKGLAPSKRGEIEISELNQSYIDDGTMTFVELGRGSFWFDAGDFENLLEASNLISAIQNRLSVIVASPEEIAFKNGWINKEQLLLLARDIKNPLYAKTLEELTRDKY